MNYDDPGTFDTILQAELTATKSTHVCSVASFVSQNILSRITQAIMWPSTRNFICLRGSKYRQDDYLVIDSVDSLKEWLL